MCIVVCFMHACALIMGLVLMCIGGHETRVTYDCEPLCMEGIKPEFSEKATSALNQ